jgi:hypothetical protein
MSRKAFEMWYDRYHTEACKQYGGIDCTDPKGIADAAWQAAHADAFERAAKVCHQMSIEQKGMGYSGRTCSIRNQRAAECRDAIRALEKENKR